MDAIHLEDLPKTNQDAVQATRALNVRYLWVDSLCILQDCETDKEQQIPRMNAYYRRAKAVISASGAIDVHAGVLGFQSTEDNIHAKAKSHLVADLADKIVEYEPHFPVYFPSRDGLGKDATLCIMDVDPPVYDYRKEPINGRGWTFQESALARRLLIFPIAGGI